MKPFCECLCKYLLLLLVANSPFNFYKAVLPFSSIHTPSRTKEKFFKVFGKKK
jgi:hypothetical protein